MSRSIPELLAPAGNWPSLYSAVEAGADAVYFGIKTVNMRSFASNFDLLEIPKITQILHKKGIKSYLTLNTLLFNKDLRKAEKILKKAQEASIDAVILWDMGVLKIAKDLGLNIHLSTQASVSNIEAIKFYYSLGVKRIVLARECSLKEIAEIIKGLREADISCEIETFIHGALCVSISGRCFLSQYTFGKSANRGECLQPCRREYLIKDTQGQVEYILGKDYILSPKDLCAIDFIDKLITAGISAFKIEGRMRSPEYVKTTVSVYKQAIKLYFEGNLTLKAKKAFKKELKKVYNRGFSTGFYLGRAKDLPARGLENEYKKVYLGEVAKFYKKIQVAEVVLRNAEVNVGDQLIFIGKTTPAKFLKVGQIQKDRQFIKSAQKGEKIGIKTFFTVKPKDKVFLWLPTFHLGGVQKVPPRGWNLEKYA